mmetsp:Transcript_44582/g.133287  ORF Transcript_44582/g.133287 Transcript_44582/m.133287 type:complete len:201 (+) Transcript_44582:201-803(+)
MQWRRAPTRTQRVRGSAPPLPLRPPSWRHSARSSAVQRLRHRAPAPLASPSWRRSSRSVTWRCSVCRQSAASCNSRSTTCTASRSRQASIRSPVAAAATAAAWARTQGRAWTLRRLRARVGSVHVWAQRAGTTMQAPAAPLIPQLLPPRCHCPLWGRSATTRRWSAAPRRPAGGVTPSQTAQWLHRRYRLLRQHASCPLT